MGDDSKLVYLCRSSIDLDRIYKGSWGGPVETIQHRFFGQDGISLRRYAFEREPGDASPHQNAILVASGDFIDCLVYDVFDEMDFGWRSDRIHRSERQSVVRGYVNGKLTLLNTKGRRSQQYAVHVEGPRVIIIDTSRTVKKRQPSVEQYAKIVARHGGISKVVNEDARAEIVFDTGAVKPEPSSQKPDDDDRYAFA